MNERLIEDLSAWERNELSMAELERNHPGEPVDALLGLHRSLSAVATEPVPDDAIAWARVRERLDARRPRVTGRLRRAAIVGAAAALLTGSAALAAPGAVQAVVNGVRHGVHAVFGGHEATTPPVAPRSPQVGGPRHRHPAHGSGPSTNPAEPRDRGSDGGSGGDGRGGSDDHANGTADDHGDRKSTRLNSSHLNESRMPSSA